MQVKQFSTHQINKNEKVCQHRLVAKSRQIDTLHSAGGNVYGDPVVWFKSRPICLLDTATTCLEV